MLRRILLTVVILLCGAIAAERSADILMALSPYRSSGTVPRGMSPAVPLLATVAAEAPAPAAPGAEPASLPEPAVAAEPVAEPFEEPAAYMAAPLRTRVTSFDGPPEPAVAEPQPSVPPLPDQSFAR